MVWEQVGLTELRAFLADAEEEGVTWEAKAEGPEDAGTGEHRLRPRQVARSVCGLANQVGGYLILGARREGNAWRLTGIDTPSDEPELWLDQIIASLRPQPRWRRKAWALGDGRMAAVVEIEPLAQTPCMTRDGQVFERVSSETITVTQPERLAELFSRGERARGDCREIGRPCHRATLRASRELSRPQCLGRRLDGRG